MHRSSNWQSKRQRYSGTWVLGRSANHLASSCFSFSISGAADRVCLSRGISSSEQLDGARLAHDVFSFSPSSVCLLWKAGWPGRCGRSRGVAGLRGPPPSPGPSPRSPASRQPAWPSGSLGRVLRCPCTSCLPLPQV